jgi:hypothetical protein
VIFRKKGVSKNIGKAKDTKTVGWHRHPSGERLFSLIFEKKLLYLSIRRQMDFPFRQNKIQKLKYFPAKETLAALQHWSSRCDHQQGQELTGDHTRQ